MAGDKKRRRRATVQPSALRVLAADEKTLSDDGASTASTATHASAAGAAASEGAVEVEYVGDDLSEAGEAAKAFVAVFGRFFTPEQLTGAAPIEQDEREREHERDAADSKKVKAEAGDGFSDSDGSDSDDDSDGGERISRRRMKEMYRMSVAELKARVKHSDLVQAWDVASRDPLLLCHLKGLRNTVPVPRHWLMKRRYLQGKRGIEKPPFRLPDFIESTGISKLRDHGLEKESTQTSKQRARERVRPKMGRLDIDYQVLHDAFFRFQTKPHLTRIGDLYYEGREFEPDTSRFRPGYVSETLRDALGMPEKAPPPWLMNMQRYGPPPSYPFLKIPGVNAPIPSGAEYGFHPGGWGKPPLDANGQPLYGDVFGTSSAAREEEMLQATIDKTRWGVLEDIEEAPVTEVFAPGEEEAADESGIASVATLSGVETPQVGDIRKRKDTGAVPVVEARAGVLQSAATEQRQLYQVLRQEEVSASGQFMGSTVRYSLPDLNAEGDAPTERVVETDLSSRGARGASHGVEVTLEPEEAESLDQAQLRAKFAANQSAPRGEDFSAMVADDAARRAKKRATAASKDSKAGSDFRF